MPRHVVKVGLGDYQKGAPEQLFLTVNLAEIKRAQYLITSFYYVRVAQFIVSLLPEKVKYLHVRFFY